MLSEMLESIPSTRDYSLNYLEFRLWIGLWVAFFGLILVATEASYLVQYFTRFTEEGFCALISLIFIYDSVKKMLSLADYFPINWNFKINDITHYNCICNLSGTGKSRFPAFGGPFVFFSCCPLAMCFGQKSGYRHLSAEEIMFFHSVAPL